MKLAVLIAALCGLGLSSAAVTLTKTESLPASAVLVDFDLPDGTVITDQYKSKGVLFSGRITAIRDVVASLYILPGSNGKTQASAGPGLTLTLSKPVASVVFPAGTDLSQNDIILTVDGFTSAGEKAASV